MDYAEHWTGSKIMGVALDNPTRGDFRVVLLKPRVQGLDGLICHVRECV